MKIEKIIYKMVFLVYYFPNKCHFRCRIQLFILTENGIHTKWISRSKQLTQPQHYIAFQFTVLIFCLVHLQFTRKYPKGDAANNAYTQIKMQSRRQVYLEEKTLLCTFNGFVRCVRNVEMYIVNNQNGFVVSLWHVEVQ